MKKENTHIYPVFNQIVSRTEKEKKTESKSKNNLVYRPFQFRKTTLVIASDRDPLTMTANFATKTQLIDI